MEKEIVDYYIGFGGNFAKLQQSVANMISQGWQPIGAITVVIRVDGQTAAGYAQKMVKYKKQ